ncbi:hypothetical protein BKG82_28010 [Mycobacteroides chelonae]|uniref:Uncharacterized protein n=1 Tax=Mycobacteroides chelonae TaxID=1774 RepID=A0A1S1LI67_MYCCH|nr:VWA domain-containing protein [Mycobacteroides chelonae]OHU46055.1 hypothetical protein BKG82_28010 [Mycobacteroides chelonae]
MNTIPVFPIWLIAVLVVLAVIIRATLLLVISRRRGRTPTGRDWARLGTATLALVCLAVAATRPGEDTFDKPRPQPARVTQESSTNVFFVVDRSANMLAGDFDGQYRNVGAVADMNAIIQKYPKARYAVISYTDTPKIEWPISADVWSFIPFVAYMQPFGRPEYGRQGNNWDDTKTSVDITSPNATLKEQLAQASKTYPGSTNLVFVFGSRTDAANSTYDFPHGAISGGAVFGYGTPAGAPIEVYGEKGSMTAVSKLNEKALSEVAANLGIPYHQRAGGPLPPEFLPPVATQQITVESEVVRAAIPRRIEYYWIFAAAAAVLFGVELFEFIGSRFRRTFGGRK